MVLLRGGSTKLALAVQYKIVDGGDGEAEVQEVVFSAHQQSATLLIDLMEADKAPRPAGQTAFTVELLDTLDPLQARFGTTTRCGVSASARDAAGTLVLAEDLIEVREGGSNA